MSQHHELEVPVSLTGLGPLLERFEYDIIELWNAPGASELRPIIRRLQVAVPQMVRIFTEQLRISGGSPQETRFWRRVHSNGTHMVWTGMGNDTPRCDWTTPDGRTIRTTPARVAWLLLKGHDVPDDTHLKRLCETPRCIAPEHQSATSDYSDRPSLRRIRKDVLSDGKGGFIHARCGHPLNRPPKPGRRVYCATCYQEDQRLLKAANEARITHLRSTYALPDYIATRADDQDEAPPEQPVAPSPRWGQKPTPEMYARAEALFDPPTDD